jgi:hypothetical protein
MRTRIESNVRNTSVTARLRLRLMRRPLERTVAFAGHRQDASLANRFTKPSAQAQVFAESNMHLGKLWLMQPYASGGHGARAELLSTPM